MTGPAPMPAKILAVDDEPDFEALIRQRFRQRIRAKNLEFRFARHGEEALAVLAEEPDIELLLLDINMPVMDGLTLLAELRTRRSGVRAIIVSAYGDMANIRTAMNRGAFDFVTKPVDLADLEVTIDKTLESIAHVRGLDRQRAAAERARANLARYFAPNLVEILADRDEPLGPVRRATVGVLFVDIVGFTGMAETMPPEQVLRTGSTISKTILCRPIHKIAWNTDIADSIIVEAVLTRSRPRCSSFSSCSGWPASR